jgi:hypothetical protein
MVHEVFVRSSIETILCLVGLEKRRIPFPRHGSRLERSQTVGRWRNQSNYTCCSSTLTSSTDLSSMGTHQTLFSTIVLVWSSPPSGSIPIMFKR